MTLHSSSPDTTSPDPTSPDPTSPDPTSPDPTSPDPTSPSSARFRELMACWPTGVAVVTSASGDRPVGCTVTALASVSASPPRLLVSLAAGSRTLRAIERTGRFGVCVLPAHGRGLARVFATGDPHTRFAGVGFDRVLDIPVLCGALAATVCAVRDRFAVTDHILVTGEPLWQVVDQSGEPAVWFRRDARELIRE
jgi:flavin reductase (DIM6/NTAB) family NADH-FMN oxidoreductase RutF